MAMTKLTLSAEKKIIELARELARKDGVSISAMFSAFIRARARAKPNRLSEPGPLTSQALNLGKKITQPTSDKSDNILEEALAQKYGIDL